jgi:squalene-hopene/tetraprenyl-beta-curcumene cyclase
LLVKRFNSGIALRAKIKADRSDEKFQLHRTVRVGARETVRRRDDSMNAKNLPMARSPIASDPEFRARFDKAAAMALEQLLAARGPEGHWTGALSSSALSTATAVTALSIVRREGKTVEASVSGEAIGAGFRWLANNANGDGGWGDTICSISNISTTALCWAAFGLVKENQAFQETIRGAEKWLTANAGGLEPAQLACAIIRRYGKDRTFSIPILTMCALTGRLGQGRAAWANVLPLPFELAALPRSWFAALRLPVVSYALPALIAIGQARHSHRPTRNPFTRLLRDATRNRTLKILAEIQPANGGFLEATPLTSFTVMSLAGSGLADHPVTMRSAEFLRRSQRADGSWPIDTNLATWVTTLSIDALANGRATLDEGTAESLRRWLLAQQFRERHSYTCAAPGGWAWTDLPGGVPDADDTAGALLALKFLGSLDAGTGAAARAGALWLVNLQNRDGGIPTFCRGWGALPFDRSAPDLTAHALRAWMAWHGEFEAAAQSRIERAMDRATQFLADSQQADGSWVPLWFGNQHAPNEENPTYGTARVLAALAGMPAWEKVTAPMKQAAAAMLDRGATWLRTAQNPDGGWSGFWGGASSIEESALALEALAAAMLANPEMARDELWLKTISRGVRWLIARIENGEWKTAAPIGFYFAKLWYFEKLYPIIFSAGATGRVRKLFEAGIQ